MTSFEQLAIPATAKEVRGFIDAGKKHPTRSAILEGMHKDLLREIEKRLPEIKAISMMQGDSAVLGMWRKMALDYHALLVNREPTPMNETV